MTLSPHSPSGKCGGVDEANAGVPIVARRSEWHKEDGGEQEDLEIHRSAQNRLHLLPFVRP